MGLHRIATQECGIIAGSHEISVRAVDVVENRSIEKTTANPIRHCGKFSGMVYRYVTKHDRELCSNLIVKSQYQKRC